MTLKYLEFDYSEDTEGVGTFDAMASTGPQQVPHVHAEIAAVLAWAFESFADGPGPLADGFAWDHDLQGQQEYTVQETLVFDAQRKVVQARTQSPGSPRHTVTLSISGTGDFCQAFRARFDLG